MASKVPAEQVLSSVLREEFAHPDQQRNWLAIAVAATNPDHPAHDFFIARRERLRAHLSSGRLGTTHDSEELTADEKVTMVMAMVDGLRIQALLDPTRVKRCRCSRPSCASSPPPRTHSGTPGAAHEGTMTRPNEKRADNRPFSHSLSQHSVRPKRLELPTF